ESRSATPQLSLRHRLDDYGVRARRRFRHTSSERDVELFRPSAIERLLTIAAPPGVMLDAGGSLAFRFQNVDVPQTEILLRLQPQHGRIPPEHGMPAGLRSVQARSDRRLVERDRVERTVEHRTRATKLDVSGLPRISPLIWRRINRFVERRQPAVA